MNLQKMTVEEYMQANNIKSRQTVYNRVQSGQLKSEKIDNRLYIILDNEIKESVQEDWTAEIIKNTVLDKDRQIEELKKKVEAVEEEAQNEPELTDEELEAQALAAEAAEDAQMIVPLAEKDAPVEEMIQEQEKIVAEQRKALGDLPERVLPIQEQERKDNVSASSNQVGQPHYVDSVAKVQDSRQSFKCDGRTHCSQMRSYEEAVFFLRNCPGVKMDGNHDGIPCEQQFNR
jgi:hypothetical protein